MASLFVVRGRDQGKHFQLVSDVCRIGREAVNEIQLLDTEASRSHAEIRVSGGASGWQIVDLSSSNGTTVNSDTIKERELHSGDRIEIGGTLMIFTGTSQPSALEAAHGVDVVLQSRANDASRIVSSLSQVAPQETAPASAIDADRSLEVMYLTALAVGRTGDLDEVLDRVLNLVFDWVEADRGCVMLRDPESKTLQPAARCDRDQNSGDGSQPTMSISRTILDYVIEQKEGVRTSDAIGDARFESAQSIVQGGVREALCVPLQGRYDIVGALYIDTYTSPGELIRTGNAQRFNDDHLRLITAIGHQAALAIEDTFYYSALVQGERLAAMGQTIATLSHHIKNILQGIRGGSYLIEAGLDRDDTDAVKRGWRIVDRNQERISNLVLDMLTFSKEREPQRIEADLNETVGDVVELMQTHAADQGVLLGCELAAELPTASFDPDALHRAVLNLVTNAIDAAAAHAKALNDDGDEDDLDSLLAESPAPDPTSEVDSGDSITMQGRVFVQTKYDAATGWLVDVVDNGPGVDAADREKIFSLFESKKGSRGTGLGLPVSAKIMREHGGEIQVLDSSVGSGCCFRLVLPAFGTMVS